MYVFMYVYIYNVCTCTHTHARMHAHTHYILSALKTVCSCSEVCSVVGVYKNVKAFVTYTAVSVCVQGPSTYLYRTYLASSH
jgi:hypothetical protein